MTADLPASGRGARHAEPYAVLARRDPVFNALLSSNGEPDPFRFHDGGRTGGDDFSALVLHIVGQQISTVVAFTLYDRLVQRVGGRLSPAAVLVLQKHELRDLGLSGSKARYVHELASRIESNSLVLDELGTRSDEEVVEQLISVPGIGSWTAEMFLIFQLHRRDVVVAADIGIRTAIQRQWDLDARPTPAAVRQLAAAWSPFRSYACALLWTSLGT